jgi:glycosyltransferase involved in cell wall biosynthesis
MGKNVLIDAREFIPGRLTGIGRVLKGLVEAICEIDFIEKITLSVFSNTAVPTRLRNRRKINIRKVSRSFIQSELTLSNLTRQGASLFISPYPKLPLFGSFCLSINTVHDVLYLTHPAYREHFKTNIDRLRLKMALKKADFTWYDSNHSMQEAKRLIGYTGTNPKVRWLAIDELFDTDVPVTDHEFLQKYNLKSGYILVVGNGLPHKNIGVLLKISNSLERPIILVGVSQKNQRRWKEQYPESNIRWLEFVEDKYLPSLIRGAFCLAQPSLAEGYGYPPLEAMACGIPAIVSHIPVLKETTGGNAMVADPNSPETWMEAFISLENPTVYQHQVEKGLNWVLPFKGRKGWRKHIEDIQKLILSNW